MNPKGVRIVEAGLYLCGVSEKVSPCRNSRPSLPPPPHLQHPQCGPDPILNLKLGRGGGEHKYWGGILNLVFLNLAIYGPGTFSIGRVHAQLLFHKHLHRLGWPTCLT